MFSELKLLIIDDKADRVNELKVILDFVGEQCLVARSDEWRAVIEQSLESVNELLAIVIGTTEHYSDLASLVLEIQQQSDRLPILLVGETPFSGSIDNSLQQQIVGRISMPPKYNQLLEVMHACQECHHNQHALSNGQKPLELFRSLVGGSQAVQQVRQLIAQVASSEASVLVLGESGTGKEVAARNIHFLSDRSDKPFVPVNCGAIPGELLESELFGHEKGAFTGALSARQGRFELAQGGTLFLDEIGDMPLSMQVKLLRVLQEKCFERVGSNRTIEADVRIIAATHRNLEQEVEKGVFREDLYYRLNVFPIDMPALRERAEDITLLINELTARLEKQGRNSVRFSPNALASLSRHSWPGNVRELANLVERMCILYPYGVVDINELPPKYQYTEGLESFASPDLLQRIDATPAEPALSQPEPSTSNTAELPASGLDLKAHMAKLEVDYITKALDSSNWVVAKAAGKLGMRRTTLVEKMKKYQIDKHAGRTNNRDPEPV